VDLLELGQIVFSKRGRDRGTAYVVVGTFVESGKGYAYLADGVRRTTQKPKKKKSIHIQPMNMLIPLVSDYLENGGDEGALNSHLREALKKYTREVSESNENELISLRPNYALQKTKQAAYMK